jgi:deazaflavin-dependent oxidoreductase (nitroreductase family)
MKGKIQRDPAALLARLSKEEYCYLTTPGRVTGKPHEIEIWFGIMDTTLYLLSGGRGGSDWVKNILKDPAVTVRIARHTFAGGGRLVDDESETAPVRKLMNSKYHQSEAGRPLSKWARTALPVAIDLNVDRS